MEICTPIYLMEFGWLRGDVLLYVFLKGLHDGYNGEVAVCR